MRATLVILLAALPATQLAAQGWPAGWESRLDRSDANVEEVEFVAMSPGWHVTTGPAAILYDPEATASGSFRVSSEIFMFDPQGRREAFGLFIGGSDLEGPDQAYTYFLIRDGGEFLVKRRAGDKSRPVAGWEANSAILAFEDREEDGSGVLNELAVEVDADECRFYVNGTQVAVLPRDGLAVDGIVGLRVNHGVNLHVTSLDVEPAGG